jgi:hypothetical protein
MGLRGSREWFPTVPAPAPDENPGKFLTSEGKDRGSGNHSRPDWVSAYGPIDESHATITVMANPANPRHPCAVRLHPTKPYFCFAPMVAGEFQIRPGEEYVSRYRFCIYDGRPDLERNRALWADYSDPPLIAVEAAGD